MRHGRCQRILSEKNLKCLGRHRLQSPVITDVISQYRPSESSGHETDDMRLAGWMFLPPSVFRPSASEVLPRSKKQSIEEEYHQSTMMDVRAAHSTSHSCHVHTL
jgi:hypothetical protein